MEQVSVLTFKEALYLESCELCGRVALGVKAL